MPKPQVTMAIRILKLAQEVFGTDVLIAVDGLAITLSARSSSYGWRHRDVHEFHSRLTLMTPNYSLVVLS